MVHFLSLCLLSYGSVEAFSVDPIVVTKEINFSINPFRTGTSNFLRYLMSFMIEFVLS